MNHPRTKPTNDQFLERAIAVHGSQYDYSITQYVGSNIPVSIICRKHGLFDQIPRTHTQGGGCPKCATEGRRRKLDDFIKLCHAVHGDRYKYSNYTKSTGPVDIECEHHGIFTQIAFTHLRGSGCPKCAGNAPWTTSTFIDEVVNKWGNAFDFSDTRYVNNHTPINISCIEHGPFKQRIGDFFRSLHPCPSCRSSARSNSTCQFISAASTTHNNAYDYTNVDYKHAHRKVTINCKVHGGFEQTPTNHLQGYGCPKCAGTGYSKKAIEWLNNIAISDNIHIRHIDNGGEYSIPGTRYRVDGFCEATNSVYEFYGDYWHGNPSKYDPNLVNTVSGMSMKELHERTLKREQHLRDLGYTVISIWESEYDAQKRETNDDPT